MLIGQLQGKLTVKNQIAFPKQFRASLGNKLIVTKGLGGYLIIVSERNWKTLLEGTENKPFTNTAARETQRYLLGNAEAVEIDNRGRFVLAEHLRRHANIREEIVFAGIERFVEVWDKKTWDQQQEQLSKTVTSVAEKLQEERE